MRRAIVTIASAAVVAATGIVITAASTADANMKSARANLLTANGTNIGSVDISDDDGTTQVKVRLTGAPGVDAFHGFHIHANDVPANGSGCVADPNAAASSWFLSADAHYNPGAQTHAHHLGDMPVVYVNADGSVETKFRIDRLEPASLDGKVIILHAGADNFANVPVGAGATEYTPNSADATSLTLKTGNAGSRIACGVISVR